MGKNILQTTDKRRRPSWLCPLIKKIFTLLILLLLLPVTALAEENAPTTLYVGSTTITAGYWTSSDGGTTWTNTHQSDRRREIATYTTTAKAPWNCTMRPSGEGLIPNQRLLAPGSMLRVAAINQLP